MPPEAWNVMGPYGVEAVPLDRNPAAGESVGNGIGNTLMKYLTTADESPLLPVAARNTDTLPADTKLPVSLAVDAVSGVRVTLPAPLGEMTGSDH